ncbi:MAG: DUF6286 domain-containing protein [Streptosporangiaceae bacterium]|jgi:hypothetical protein
MRLLNRPLAFILAVALAGASVILIVEVIAFAVHAHPVIVQWTTWYHWAEKTRWNTTVVRAWSAILIVVGALVLALELKPRRATRLALRSQEQATDSAMTRGGLAGTLRTAATGVDGIASAAVTVSRRRARVAAGAAARGRAQAEALRQPVTEALRRRLDGLDMQHAPRLTVRITSRSR